MMADLSTIFMDKMAEESLNNLYIPGYGVFASNPINVAVCEVELIDESCGEFNHL